MIKYLFAIISLSILAACATVDNTSVDSKDYAETLGLNRDGITSDERHRLTVRSNASFKDIDFRKSTRSDDVDCQNPHIYSGFEVSSNKPYRHLLLLSRNVDFSRSLFEWHFCFIIDGITYRAWRGFDPGPYTDLAIECFIGKRQITLQDTSKYLCETTHITQNSRNHTEYAIHCWEENHCKSFDTADDFRRWKLLNPLSSDELFEIADVVLDRVFSQGPDYLINYFVSIGGYDLPQDLTAKYTNEKVVFYPFKEFKVDAGSNVQIGMNRFELVEPGLAIGTYSTYCGALCASSHTIIVEKKNGIWTIKSFQMDWIS